MVFDIDDAGLVGFAQTLARTPSQSGTEQAAVELTAETFRELGFDEVEVDPVGNAIGIMGSGDGPRLLIDGHIDSIPLHSIDSWSVDPFGGEIVGSNLYGLGICDQKGSIAAAAYGLAAARRRAPRFAGTVALVASVCEEDIEGAALAPFVQRFRPDFAVTSEPNDTRLCIGQKGRAKIELRVRGRASHAGHAGRGVNAAEALALVIGEVRNLGHPVHDRLGRRLITCIDIASSPYPSVSTVPAEAMARFDCRFLPGETADSLRQTLSQCVDRALVSWTERPEVTIGLVQAEFSTWTGSPFSLPEFEPAWWTDEDSPLVQAATVGLTSVGIDATPTHYSFCTNGSYLAGEAGIPTIGFGVGLEQMAHQVDECISLDSLRSGAQGFAALATQLVGSQPHQ
jgi:putative selenium metabolism hydrolase